MKVCNNKNCKQINPQPLQEFVKNKVSKDGLNYRCKSCVREVSARWLLNNSEINKSNSKLWYGDNKDKKAESVKAWNGVNSGKRAAYKAKRRAAKLQRTPLWSDLEAIEKFYEQCPAGYEVDHVVPLQGENVSGLHVLENLQYLTKSQNSSKGNQYP